MAGLVYVGNYTDSIYGCALGADGALTKVNSSPAGGPAPSFLAKSAGGKFVYATLEGGAEGQIASFSVGAGGALTALNVVGAGGLWPCHVLTNGTQVFCANYGGGNISSFNVQPDGSLSVAVATMQHEGALAHCEISGQGDRQEAAHAHQVCLSPDGKYLFSMDLGHDTVFCWALDAATGLLTANGSVRLAEKAGPRHLCFHPSGKHAYLINELSNTVVSFDYADGKLSETGTSPCVPEGATFNKVPPPYEAGDFDGTVSCCADIHAHPNGKFVYGSNRGHDSITTFAVSAADGTLTVGANTPTQGFTPRNFVIAADGLTMLVANQNAGAVEGGTGGGNVVAFAIDGETGALTPTGAVSEMKWPVCVLL